MGRGHHSESSSWKLILLIYSVCVAKTFRWKIIPSANEIAINKRLIAILSFECLWLIILTFYCIHTLQHVSSGLSPSIFSLNPVSTLPLPLAVFGMLAPRFGTHSLLIWGLSTLTQPSNPTSRLIFILFCKHFWPLTILYALLINISCYFSAEIILQLQLQLQFDEKHRKVLFNPLCNP
jgi:hypothetical protein